MKVQRYLEELLELPLVGGRLVDSDRDIPIRVLSRLKSGMSSGLYIHPVQRALNELVVEGKEYAGTVTLDDIRAISATKGGTTSATVGFHMNLDCLPETMDLREGESFGPLSKDEMNRLYEAICRELPLHQGNLHLQLQVWDGTYIALNNGASRRFALLRRLDRRRSVNAVIRPYYLSFDNLSLLRQRWRVVVLSENPGVLDILVSLSNLCGDEFWVGDRVKDNLLLMAIPCLSASTNGFTEPLSRLHRRFDEIGVFDVGRYLTEQIALSRHTVPAQQ